ncbi:MAG: amidohydrolase family protein, partial [Clostridia bacterium]|nr:amidohydrolase family protein [Clostridia bacterium]
MLIYTNAVIHTMNSGDVEAMAVENGKIVALGSLADLRLQYGAREVDLGGACVVPGFTDSHCHVLHTGADMSRLSFRSCRSVEDMIRV